MMTRPSVVQILTSRSCRWAVRNCVALTEKGIEFELVNVVESGKKLNSFLVLTPFGKTPVLRHGAVLIPESLVINEYIDDVFAGRPLRSSDLAARAWERVWMQFCDHTLMGFVSELAKAGDAQARDTAIEGLAREAARLEAVLRCRTTSGPLWSGRDLTLPDLCYHTFFEALGYVEGGGFANLRLRFPALLEWQHALGGLDAFRRANALIESLPDDRAAVSQ